MVWAREDDLDSVCSTDSMTRGLQVKPFFYSFVHDEFSAFHANIVQFRRSLPMRVSVLVERKLSDGILVVSNPAATSLRVKQIQFQDLFDALQPKKVNPKDVIPGRDFLFKNPEDEVFRVRVLEILESAVSIRLIDFNLNDITYVHQLYEMPDLFVEGQNKFAFVGRVNLPPRSLTNPLGLPHVDLIHEGDRIELIIMTAVEPHLAIFGFSQSISRGIPMDRMLDGFTAQDSTNWIELVRGGRLEPTAVSFPLGFGRLQKRDRHENRLAIVINVETLDRVHVRDIDSSIRLSMLKDRLQDLYSEVKFAQTLKYTNLDDVVGGMGCVAEHPENHQYYRAEVVSFGIEDKVHVRAIDHPDLPAFSVPINSIFRPVGALNFARQFFTVAMTRHSKSLIRFHLSQLATCLIPSGTPVILRTDPRDGLTTILSANASNGVLESTGFFKLGEKADEIYDPTTTVNIGFACEPVVQTRGPEAVDSLTSSVSKIYISNHKGRTVR